jgi:HEAT repeat protein
MQIHRYAIQTTALACAILVLSTGCMPRQVPSWAIHVKPPQIDPNKRLNDMKNQLISELDSGQLRPGYIPAEQIAALALHEIRLGHGFDAAVLLSIASYRYFQQGVLVFDAANKNVPYNVNSAVYERHVKSELDIFLNMDFNPELKYLFAKLDYDEKLAQRYEKGRWQLLGVNESKRDDMRRELIYSIEAAYHAPVEHLHAPHLADAFLERLLEDTRSKTHAIAASYTLANTPLKKFQLSALQFSDRYFLVPLCVQMAHRLSVYRQDVQKSLHSPRPKERSNAAMILALRPSDENLALLMEIYEKEMDKHVRLSLEYALLQHGKGNLRNLEREISQCREGSACDHAIQLIEWLSPEKETSVSPDTLASILNDKQNTDYSRMFAATILGSIGLKKRLNEHHLRSLLAATTDESEYVTKWAVEAIKALPQLDRPAITALMRLGFPNHSLFERWSAIAEPSDLPEVKSFLNALSSRSQLEQIALINLLGSIKGTEARDLLIKSYKQFQNNRFQIAVTLLIRGDTRYEQLAALAEVADGAGAVALKMGAKTADADLLASQMLKEGDPNEQIRIIRLVGHLGRDRLVPKVQQLISYSNNAYYPGDALVRHAALSLIVSREIQRSKRIGRLKKLPGEEVTNFRNGS